MLVCVVVAVLTGAVLGMRYSVLSLVPVTLVAWIGLAAFAVSNDLSIMTAVAICVGVALALQFGYVVGVTAQYCLVVSRARSMAKPAPARMPAVEL
ncbi:hypothetical protein RHODGE_RHODGE_03587 [Rhodoplanes serenus]|uniref:Uncharacterized protein n=1 Tax=Rhodoplanes serenus TaxID=200615 RepID=A0A447CYL5_9BRAD|nr:hypothetical protein [Rhodoplanes serenus]VCU10397.1 hypothetical protein RHODGE_RHODGE_03587 [Rhodoplanes serenus]